MQKGVCINYWRAHLNLLSSVPTSIKRSLNPLCSPAEEPSHALQNSMSSTIFLLSIAQNWCKVTSDSTGKAVTMLRDTNNSCRATAVSLYPYFLLDSPPLWWGNVVIPGTVYPWKPPLLSHLITRLAARWSQCARNAPTIISLKNSWYLIENFGKIKPHIPLGWSLPEVQSSEGCWQGEAESSLEQRGSKHP